MSKIENENASWAGKSARSSSALKLWNVGWVLSTALAAFGPKFIWSFATLPSLGAILLNIAVGWGMVLANGRYLKNLDEMQRQIFLEAGALSLGVGLVLGCSYEILEDIRLISFEPEISHLIIVMCLSFAIGMIKGNRKYQ